LIVKSDFVFFHVKLCRLNFYEFVRFITFNIEVHDRVSLYVYSFLVDRILVSNVPRATVRIYTLKPKKPKNLKKIKKP